MKKLVIAMVVIIILGVVLCAIGCAVYVTGDNKFFGKAVEYTERTYVSDEAFDSLKLNLKESHHITFKNGDSYSVRYFDSEIFPISVSTNNGAVTVSENGLKHWWERLKYKISTTDVEITVPVGTVLTIDGSLDGYANVELPSWEYGDVNLKVRGSADISGANIKVQDMKIDVSGSVDLSLSGSFKDINIDSSGSADISVSGTANSLVADTSGSMDLKSTSLICPNVDLHASGSMDIALSGTGNILKVRTSGSSDIYAKGFNVTTASLKASGSIRAEVAVSEKLSIDASGSATVHYWGNPQIDRHVSGSAKITKQE